MEKVQAFFAVVQGCSGGYLNAQGEIAKGRAPHLLTSDRAKAEAAANAYNAAVKSGKRATVGWTKCFPAWLGTVVKFWKSGYFEVKCGDREFRVWPHEGRGSRLYTVQVGCCATMGMLMDDFGNLVQPRD